MYKVFVTANEFDEEKLKEAILKFKENISNVYFLKNVNASDFFLKEVANNIENKNNHVKLLAEELKILASADFVVFIGDWTKDKRCRMLYRVCKEYAIETLEFNDRMVLE